MNPLQQDGFLKVLLKKYLLYRKMRWGGKWASAGLFCLFPLPDDKKSCSALLAGGCRHSKFLLEAVVPCSPSSLRSIFSEPICTTGGRNECRAPLSPSWIAFCNLLFSQLWDLLCPGVKVINLCPGGESGDDGGEGCIFPRVGDSC